jgi:DNA-binding NarL/FixJ family response regulator
LAEPIRVLLVDAPTLSRRGLAALLSRRSPLRVVGEAATGREALDLVRASSPDVVVVEPAVPEGGPALVAELCRVTPGCAVLVLALGGEGGAVGRALQAGARAYLQKDCEPRDLVRAIERVHAGELVIAPMLAETAVKELSGGQARAGPAGLTARELQVLRLVAEGRTNPEIARLLCITEHTTKGHLAKILRKVALDNRVQLTAYAIQQGLAAPSGAGGSAPEGAT